MSSREFYFHLLNKSTDSNARRGVIHTPSGEVQTPAFSPVGTKASVKALSPEDLSSVGSQVILANTYHLMLRPGIETIKKFEGFADFMNWDGPSITDSGGYQVSFLWSPDNSDHSSKVKITDEGAYFSSHIDGTERFLSPEKSIQIQQVLGADIIMAFDQPMSSEFTKQQNTEAYKRTFDWEERSYKEWDRLGREKINGEYQALFGIVHGMQNKQASRDFFDFLLNLDFPGYAIGDETIGSDPKAAADTLDTIKDMIPEDRPMHALGLGGGPEGVFTAVERGVDIFDNTSVTRMARSGLLFVFPSEGGNIKNKFRVNIKKSKFSSQSTRFSEECKCESCINYSAAYIHHLHKSKEILGMRLATVHNLFFMHSLMQEIRKSIENNNFIELKNKWLN